MNEKGPPFLSTILVTTCRIRRISPFPEQFCTLAMKWENMKLFNEFQFSNTDY